MATVPINTATIPQTTTAPKATGAGSLTSDDFMKLMLKQLASQDPLNPSDSNQLLQQIAQISTLQSNQTLQTSLTSMTLQQSIGAAGNLIGKAVQGIDANGNSAVGAVKSVRVQKQQVYLELESGTVLPMANVVAITSPTAATGGAATTAPTPGMLANLTSALSALGLK